MNKLCDDKLILSIPNRGQEDSIHLPHFLPGDIAMTEDHLVGVIVQAQVVADGAVINWNGELPESIKHGSCPSYAIDSIPGYPPIDRHAWWREDELTLVELGPLHDRYHSWSKG